LEPIHQQLLKAYTAQSKIGWGQFFHGKVAIQWKHAIGVYYKECRPGNMYTPDQEWLRTTIDALWHFSLTLWCQRCHEFHGHNGVLSQEALWKDSLARAMATYHTTYEHNPTPAHWLLHHRPIHEMINWTKQHLDAYLAMAEMACEWNVEPG
jgi:hypothetical protein